MEFYQQQIIAVQAEIKELEGTRVDTLSKVKDERNEFEIIFLQEFPSKLAKLEEKEKWLAETFRLALATNSGENNFTNIFLKQKKFSDVEVEEETMNSCKSVDFRNFLSKFIKVQLPVRDNIISMIDFPFQGIDGKDLLEMVQNLSGRIGVLVNVSGSGKTRKCFEMLKIVFGIYIDANSSADFIYLLSWIEGLSKRCDATKLSDIQHLEHLFHEGFGTLIAVRQKYMSRFANSVDWLLFQRSRRGCQLMGITLKKLLADGYCLVPIDLKIPVVMDEADLLLEIMPTMFECKKDKTKRRSLYYAYCRYAKRFSLSADYLNCGTAFSLRHVDITVSAGMTDPDEKNDVQVFHATKFLTATDIHGYLNTIFFGFEESNLSYICHVLAGRARSLARFVKHFCMELTNNDIRDEESLNQLALKCVNEIITIYCCTFYPQENDYSSRSFLMFWYRFVPPHNSELWIHGNAPESFAPFESNENFNLHEELLKFLISGLNSDCGDVKMCLGLIESSPNIFYFQPNGSLYQIEYLQLISGIYFFAQTMTNIQWSGLFHKILFGSNELYSPQMKGCILELYIGLKLLAFSLSGRRLACHPLLSSSTKPALPFIDQNAFLSPCSSFETGDRDGAKRFHRIISGRKPTLFFPSKTAGPDIICWPFYIGVKSSYTCPFVIDVSVSKKNYRSLVPEYLFLKNHDREKNNPNENSKALGTLVRQQGFIRVLIEFPCSKLKSEKWVLDNDSYILRLDIDSAEIANLMGQSFVDCYKKYYSE